MRRRRLGAATFAALLATAGAAWAQPANDDCANATALSPGSLPFSETVDTATATNDGDASAGAFACAASDHSIWYEFTAGASDVILVLDAFEGSAYVENLAEAYAGTCGALGGVLPHEAFIDSGENMAVRVSAGTTVLVCLADFGGSGGSASVQLFEAPEFVVAPDGYRASDHQPAATADVNGNFLVVWSSEEPANPSGAELRARLMTAAGAPVGATVALDDREAFWTDASDRGADGVVAAWVDFPDVKFQRFDTAGAPAGGVTVANQTNSDGAVGVDSDAAGNFVLAWGGPTFRLFDSAGTPLGNEQPVDGGATWLDVARDDAGNFMVVWEAASYDGIAAQRFTPDGTSAGGAFVIDTGDTYGYTPAVAAAPTGEMLVVWEGDYTDVFGQAFDAAGSPQGGPFRVSSGPSEYLNHRIRVSSDAAGNFVVVWEDDGGRTDYDLVIDISGRRVSRTGSLLGPEFLASSVNWGFQYFPAVGAAPAGDFMVVWNDYDANEVWGSPIVEPVVARHFAADAFLNAACPLTVASGCRATILPGKAKLLVRNDGTDPEDLAINWKLVKGEATAAADFGDPLATDDLFFCLYDAGGALVTQAALPAAGLCAGKPCWKGLGKPPGAKGFKYKDTERTPNGVLKAVLKGGEDGKTKVVFKAGRGNLAAGPAGGPPTIPIAGSLTAQLHAPSTGTCWSATFDAATAKRNSGGIFQGSGD